MTRNVQELSVSELSRALKRTVEDSYAHIRVRGEISGFKKAGSGHMYMALKDSDAVLDAVCWRGSASRLMTVPEDGLEVIATGRLTTYPGRSKYQLVIEQVELAGEGALLKLLEDRKRRLAEEGLFDPERKKEIPFLPSVIGVVTSPTGAVIRDILHRLSDRFARPVILWPVLVQGEGAAEQVAAAIKGFNSLQPGGAITRPDLLIVARGGGSLEDLWAFNEEIVVRAAAESDIPLISAVGHETDTTLIDFASDRRAPTPTAAAEMAVPVRAELLGDITNLTERLVRSGARGIVDRRRYLEGLARGLPRQDRLLEPAQQRLDEVGDRHHKEMQRYLSSLADRLRARTDRLRSPREKLQRDAERLSGVSERMHRAMIQMKGQADRALIEKRANERMMAALTRLLSQKRERVEQLGLRQDAMSYKRTLARGFAVIHGPDGVITRADAITDGTALEIEFQDDKRIAVASDVGTHTLAKPPKKSPTKKKVGLDDQAELF